MSSSFGLVTDAVYINYTKKIWSMASYAAKNRMLEQERLFHTRMTPSESLMVTDGALKLNYTSVLFVDPGVQIDET